MVIERSGLSAKALFRTDMELKGKVLYIQEVAGSEDAEFTIRILQSDGKLVYEATEKDTDGTMRNVVHEKEGPPWSCRPPLGSTSITRTRPASSPSS
jgi:hypothetical protein